MPSQLADQRHITSAALKGDENRRSLAYCLLKLDNRLKAMQRKQVSMIKDRCRVPAQDTRLTKGEGMGGTSRSSCQSTAASFRAKAAGVAQQHPQVVLLINVCLHNAL
jgi:hypothetical protein